MLKVEVTEEVSYLSILYHFFLFYINDNMEGKHKSITGARRGTVAQECSPACKRDGYGYDSHSRK